MFLSNFVLEASVSSEITNKLHKGLDKLCRENSLNCIENNNIGKKGLSKDRLRLISSGKKILVKVFLVISNY